MKRKSFFVTLLLLAVFSSPSFAVMAMPEEAAQVLEVTGTLEKVLSDPAGEIVVLNVSGQEASGPLSPDCVFLDESDRKIDKENFLRRYMKRYVTLELDSRTGVVSLCRVGS